VTRVKTAALEKLGRLARRHPRFDPTLSLFHEDEDVSDLIRATWGDNLLSCLKRNTVGAYALAALDTDWSNYVAFHVEIVGCEVCLANLDDLKREKGTATETMKERFFASSIGFLKKVR
jgi:hypothetical protein